MCHTDSYHDDTSTVGLGSWALSHETREGPPLAANLAPWRCVCCMRHLMTGVATAGVARWQRMKPTQHRYTRVHPGDGTHTNDTPMKAAWRSSQRTPACTVTTHEGSRSGSRWQRMKPIPPTQHRWQRMDPMGSLALLHATQMKRERRMA